MANRPSAATTPTRPGAVPSPLVVGVVVWLTSEVLFFGALFGAWFSLRSANAGVWPPEGAEVERLLPTIGTVLLLSSSATVQLAARAARPDPDLARRWLMATVALGTVFLGLQAREWATLPFSVDDHAYGTAFFALTGFHGLHVLGGLAAMSVLARHRPAHHDAVEVVSLYWHFVDGVWLVLFASVYLAG